MAEKATTKVATTQILETLLEQLRALNKRLDLIELGTAELARVHIGSVRPDRRAERYPALAKILVARTEPRPAPKPTVTTVSRERYRPIVSTQKRGAA
jgi:hypothetical protein